MYDQNKIVTITGVVKQFVPQANHAEFHFLLLRRRSQVAREGQGRQDTSSGASRWPAPRSSSVRESAPKTFGAGTVISVNVNPLRDGIELRRPRRRARQVPDGSGDQEAEAAGARQALRLGCRPHADRRHELLTLRTFAAEFRVHGVLSSAARSRAPTHVSIFLCMPRHGVRSRPRSSACDSANRGGPVRRRYSSWPP